MRARLARGRGVLTQVVLLVLVLAGGWLVLELEEQRGYERPYVTRGAAGEEVQLAEGSVRVEGIRVAELLDAGFAGELVTDGVWVAVEVWATGDGAPLAVSSFRLLDASGRTFDASTRVLPNAPGIAQPGSPVGADIVFEVPRDALGDLTLLVSTQSDERLAPVAHADLQVEKVSTEVLVPLPATLGPPA